MQLGMVNSQVFVTPKVTQMFVTVMGEVHIILFSDINKSFLIYFDS